MGRDIKGAIDTRGEYTALFIGIGIVVFLALVAGGVYVYNTPELDDRIYAFTHEQPEFSGESVDFRSEYDGVNARGSINKVYSDTNTEYGWCMRLEGSTVESFDHFSGLNKTTPEQIRFSCNAEKHNGIMHTHPGRHGITAMSDQDKESLRTVAWIDVSCVVGGEISVLQDVNPEGVKCYHVVDDEIRSLEVNFD